MTKKSDDFIKFLMPIYKIEINKFKIKEQNITIFKVNNKILALIFQLE